MAVPMFDHLMRALPELRFHPIGKRIRASVDTSTIVDTTQAMVVWEPRRVVPSYAVPVADISGSLVTSTSQPPEERPVRMGRDGPPVLDPSTPFAVHTCPGESFTIRTDRGVLVDAAFAPADADLAGYVVLDWDRFTGWREEEEDVLGHPHDPFDRIDCLRSSRHVLVAAHGQVLADTRRATLLFETPLPVRYYLPREDVRTDLLEASTRSSVCAYKGVASYWSVRAGDQVLADVAWSYPRPLHDAQPVRDLICFFAERVDMTVDGVPLERPVTPWS